MPIQIRSVLAIAAAACLFAVARAAVPENPAPGVQKVGEPKPGAPKTAGATVHEGVWKPVGAVLGGVRVPPPVLKTITLKITGTNYEVTVEAEKEPDRGTCILDISATPHRMTIKSTDGPNRGKTFLAIYEMKDAGKLRVCYDLSGTEFPKEFKAPKGTQLYLVGYRRPQG